VGYDFADYDDDLEPQACSLRGGGPPRKGTGIGVLDAPIPPKGPPGPVASAPTSVRFRIFAGLVLAGLAAAILYLLFGIG
jgi:hypothetical protein